MLPAQNRDRISLADVLPSCLAALQSADNRMSLPGVDRVVVILVDGLGAAALRARAGHARTLAGAMASTSITDSGFPTTTAAALATLTTGALPGQTGMVGYSVLDADHDRLVNQLSGWDADLDPRTWQRQPTVFETVVASGMQAVVIGPARYSDSGFTHAVLRGAAYRSAASIQDRFDAASAWLREPGPRGIAYLYVPELDATAHAKGWESSAWTERLETLDAVVRDFVNGLRRGDGIILTADHGIIDVPGGSHVLVDGDPELVRGVRFVGGEPRCLQLYFEPDLSVTERDSLVARWRDSESGRSWVVTRQEAIDADWFGVVDPVVEPRIGDLLVAARKNIAYYDTRSTKPGSRDMIGQHGSWSPAERQVPMLRFGAFA